MSNLTENTVWESGIYQLETTDPVLGGEPNFVDGSPTEGHANAQAQQLANRTNYLKQRIDEDLANTTDPAKGAGMVGFVQSGVGAQGRSARDKMAERVSIADYGAVLDGVTDDLPAYNKAIDYLASVGGGSLLINPGVMAVSDELRLPSNIHVDCRATIKLLQKTATGSALAIYGPISGSTWEGGVVDCNNVSGDNGVGVSGSSGIVRDVKVIGVTSKNAVRDPVTLGGKGFAMHSGCEGVQFIGCLAEDCDIGVSHEATDTTPSTGNYMQVVVRRARKMGAYFNYGSATGLGNSNNFNCRGDLVFDQCDISSSSGFGIVNFDRANGLLLDVIINNAEGANEVVPFWGTITNSKVRGVVDVKDITHLLVINQINGGGSDYPSSGLDFDVLLHVKGATNAIGYLVQSQTSGETLTKSFIRVAFDGFAGAGLMNTVNSSLHYDFRRLSDGYHVFGNDTALPAFGSARQKLIGGGAVQVGSVSVLDSGGGLLSILQPVNSTWQMEMRDGAGNPMLRTKTPASGEAGVMVRYNNGTSTILGTVRVGGADSGGAGYRTLVVPN